MNRNKLTQRYAFLRSDVEQFGLPALRNDRSKRIPVYKRGGKARNMNKQLRDLLFADHTKVHFDYDNTDRPFNRIWNPVSKRLKVLKGKRGVIDETGHINSNCLGHCVYEGEHLVDKHKLVSNQVVPFFDRQIPSIRDCADTYFVDVDLPGLDGFKIISRRMATFVKKMVKKHGGAQYRVVTHADFYHPTKPEEGIHTLYLTTDKRQVVLRKEEVIPLLKVTEARLKDIALNMEMAGSGWVFERVIRHQMDVVCYAPHTGSSFLSLPQWVADRYAVFNPDNKKDNKCFKHCFTIHNHKDTIKHHRGRMSQYKKLKDTTDFSGLTFPVGINQIPKFEKRNPKYAVTVFVFMDKGVDKYTGKPDGCIRRVYKTKNDPNMNEGVVPVDLLLIEDQDQDRRHYTYINNLSRLMSVNVSKHNGKVYLCRNCLKHKHSAEALKKHQAICDTEGSVFPIMPPKGEVIKFKNHLKQFHQNFVIYSDFETFPRKLYGPTHKKEGSYTTKTHIHKPCSFCIYVTCTEKEYKFEPIAYRGPDAAAKCVEMVNETVEKLKVLNQQHESINDIIFKPGEEEAYEKATICCICNKELGGTRSNNPIGPCKIRKDGVIVPNDIDNGKVRHHNHLTGEVYHIDRPGYGGGAAHNACNRLIHTRWEKIPVFFHNLKGFDGHLLVKPGSEQCQGKASIIPQNTEKYISMTFDSTRYLDSFAFLASGLEKLAAYLLDEGLHKFKHVLRYFGDKVSPFLIHHLVKKGFYPYSYMNCFERFDETDCFKQEDFYDELSEEHISDEDYQCVVKMWNELGIKNKGEWHDLYLKLDVLLLADVFENFRKVSFENFGLDPANSSWTLPNFGFDCMLKMTDMKLELMSELEVYLLYEKDIRGGISAIFSKYAKANNPYLDDYDPSKPTSFINCLDANNLYGGIMRMALAFGGLHFRDVSTYMKHQFDKLMKETKRRRINKIEYKEEEVSDGFDFEVDLYYPPELHDLHNDYPMAVERKCVTKDMLSPLQRSRKATMSKIPKLIPGFGDKDNMIKNYLVHYRNLEYYLSKGLVLKKVHRIIGYKQRPWMRKYIDFCTEKRKKATNAFEKDYWKKMIVVNFGKTMESVRKRFKLELIKDPKTMKKYSNSLEWDGHTNYGDGLFGVKRRAKEVKLNKPIYVGFAILELSKLHMLQFHYDYMKPKYGDKCRVLFSDTDSMSYHVFCDDLYIDMKQDSHLFDLSNYPKDHFMYDPVNKKIPLLMKEETAGKYIKEFVGLKAKMYSFLLYCLILNMYSVKKTGKGIPKKALKKQVNHKDYRKALFEPDWTHYVEFNTIRSKNHELANYHQKKKGLNSYDDKSYLLSGGISQLRHNHYRIKSLV